MNGLGTVYFFSFLIDYFMGCHVIIVKVMYRNSLIMIVHFLNDYLFLTYFAYLHFVIEYG